MACRLYEIVKSTAEAAFPSLRVTGTPVPADSPPGTLYCGVEKATADKDGVALTVRYVMFPERCGEDGIGTMFSMLSALRLGKTEARAGKFEWRRHDRYAEAVVTYDVPAIMSEAALGGDEIMTNVSTDVRLLSV